ncbi:NAD(P)-binding domain-containing protein [Arthrobacter alpinus]|nr:NAD(P)-binding domain-containing protein [Arthrobacter alpinus]
MLKARHSVQILGRNGEKTRELVEILGAGAQGGGEGAVIEGGIVFLAVPFAEAKKSLLFYGETLAGRVIVDISNPVDLATFDSLVTPAGTSAAEEIALHASPGHLLSRRSTPASRSLWSWVPWPECHWMSSLPVTRNRPRSRSVQWLQPQVCAPST